MRAETMYRDSLRFQIGHERVFPREKVRDLHVKAPWIEMPRRLDEKPLSSAPPQPLCEPEDSRRLIRTDPGHR